MEYHRDYIIVTFFGAISKQSIRKEGKTAPAASHGINRLQMLASWVNSTYYVFNVTVLIQSSDFHFKANMKEIEGFIETAR